MDDLQTECRYWKPEHKLRDNRRRIIDTEGIAAIKDTSLVLKNFSVIRHQSCVTLDWTADEWLSYVIPVGPISCPSRVICF